MSQPPHLLVVDDHPVVRLGVAQLLRDRRDGAEVSEAATFDEALALLARRADVALVILDCRLPGLQGLQGLRQLRQRWPLLPVLMLSAHDDPLLAAQALREGASGWLAKSADARLMRHAVDLVLDGGCYLPPFMARSEPHQEGLTPRQQAVLALLLRGLSNKEIARELGMAEPTVKGHLVTIFRVLRVRNRAEAVAAALARRTPDGPVSPG